MSQPVRQSESCTETETRPDGISSLLASVPWHGTAFGIAPALSLSLALAIALSLLIGFSGSTSAADSVEAPKPLLLISQDEISALPADHPVSLLKEPTSPNGPTIQIDSPTHNARYAGPFPIKVVFLPVPKGHPVDLDSLRLEYKRAWGIDITDRVREYIRDGVIDVSESELPTGRHTVEIEIADVKRQISRRIFTVIIE